MNAPAWLARPELAALTWALVHFLWQGTLVAAALAAILWSARVCAPRQRYACSLVALAVMALCPCITFVMVLRPEAAPIPVVPTDEIALPARSAAAAGGWRWRQLGESVQPYVLVLWTGGVCTLSLRLAGGLFGVWRLRQSTETPPRKLAQRVERLGRLLGIDARRRVLLSRRVSEALVAGFFRPVVLVPASWASEMPLEMLEAIVAHELAHLRRHDLWVNLLQRMVETLLFYHPAVWWVSRRARLAREMCCDELAVRVTGRPVTYVEALELVACERLTGVRPVLSAGIRGETNMKLLARVRNVLGPTGDSGSWWPAGVLALLLPLAIWSVTFGTLSPNSSAAWAEEDEDDDEDREDRDDDDEDRDEREDRDDDDEGEDDDDEEGDDDDDDDDDDDERGDRRRKERDANRDDDDDDRREEARRDKVKEDLDALILKLAGKKDAGGEVRDKPKPREEAPEKDPPPRVKKIHRDGDPPKKELKDPVKKADRDERQEGEALWSKKIKPAAKQDADQTEVAQLAAMIKELRVEVDRLRAEVQELRGGEEGAKNPEEAYRRKPDAAKERQFDRDAAERKYKIEKDERNRDAYAEKIRAAVEAKLQAAEIDKLRAAENDKLRAAAEAKLRAAEEDKLRGAAEEKFRADAEAKFQQALAEKYRAAAEAKEREAAERKEAEASERKKSAAGLAARSATSAVIQADRPRSPGERGLFH